MCEGHPLNPKGGGRGEGEKWVVMLREEEEKWVVMGLGMVGRQWGREQKGSG